MSVSWSKRRPNGMCSKLHRIEGDNVLLRMENGIERQRCRICYGKQPRKKKIKLPPKPPRFERFILSVYDETPRTINQWAAYAGVDDITLRKQLRRGISLENAVEGLRDGTLRRKTAINPHGCAQQREPPKHRCAIAVVDDVVRSVREWAEYLDVRLQTLRKRIFYRGSLEAAVLFTMENEWHSQNTSDRCKRNHEFTEENTRISTNAKGNVRRICVKCARARASITGKLLRQKRKKPKSDMCRKGLHKMEGYNVYMSKAPGGIRVPVCRACRNEYQNQRNELKRKGLPTRKETYGKTLDEKLALNIDRDPYGCAIWKGTLDANKRPKIYYMKEGKLVCMLVRTYMWERKEGTKLPPAHMTMDFCGSSLCVEGAHLYAAPLRERTHSKEACEKAAVTKARVREGTAEQAAIEAMRYVDVIRRAVCLRLGASRADADDVVQETVIRTVNAWANGVVITNLPGYMATIASRVAIDAIRQRNTRGGRHISIEDALYEDMSDARLIERAEAASMTFDDPGMLLERMEQYEIQEERYKALVNGLPEKLRQVFRLRAMGARYEVIAKVLGKSHNTIEQQICKLNRILRRDYTADDLLVFSDADRLPV